MKTVVKIASIAALSIAMYTFGSGCSGPTHVSGAKFIMAAERSPVPTYSSHYLGATGSRAYQLESQMWPFIGFRETIVSTKLSELPPEVASELKAGTNPWSFERMQKRRDAKRRAEENVQF